jgi:hypothetical protein
VQNLLYLTGESLKNFDHVGGTISVQITSSIANAIKINFLCFDSHDDN